jgi:RHS repeat-associated protein
VAAVVAGVEVRDEREPCGCTTSNVAGVGTDSAGDLYVADTYNYEVDEVPTSSGAVTASYAYNGDGLEASPTVSGTLSQFTGGELAGSGLPVVISDSANDYVYGPSGTPVEQVALATSTPTYLTYTASDSSWLSTNQAGDETGFWRYDAFGTLALGTPTSPFGYSGQYTDASTGFVNDTARWYQAQTGGFTTRDPAFASTDTAYSYAGDDPVNESDPSGQAPAAILPEGGGGITPQSCETLGPKTPFPYQWAECAYDTLASDALSPIVDAAVVANLQAESLYFEDWNKTVCYLGTCGFGIGQWTVPGPRYTQLTEFAGTHPSFFGQVQFVDVELTTGYSFVLSNVNQALVGMTSLGAELATATTVVEEEYEAPTGVNNLTGCHALNCYSIVPGSDAATSLELRQYFAIEIYDAFAGGHVTLPPEPNETTLALSLPCLLQ